MLSINIDGMATFCITLATVGLLLIFVGSFLSIRFKIAPFVTISFLGGILFSIALSLIIIGKC